MSCIHRMPFVLLLVGLALVIGASGCGGLSTTDVTGTITLNGKPPKYAGLQIIFQHPEGKQVVAAINEDGTYKAEGVPAGEVKVCFTYLTPDMVQQGNEFKAGKPRLAKPGDLDKPAPKPKTTVPTGPKESPIPQPLRDTSTSKLTTKVEAGKTNTFNYDIK